MACQQASNETTLASAHSYSSPTPTLLLADRAGAGPLRFGTVVRAVGCVVSWLFTELFSSPNESLLAMPYLLAFVAD